MVHQGVAPLAIASLVSHHYESLFGESLTLQQLERLLQTDAWLHYRQYCKRTRTQTCSTAFNLSRFNRETWQNFPELASCYKGAVVKGMIYWVADFLRANADPSDAGSLLRVDCSYWLAQFQYLQDAHDAWLDEGTAGAMATAGRRFLLFYQKLAADSKPGNHRLYHITPKFHCLLHMCLKLPVEMRNPRFDHLYMEEDFMKEIGRIASRAHANTMDRVTLLRYRCLLEMCDLGDSARAYKPHQFFRLGKR